MSEQMEFPKTFDEFVSEYGFKDKEEVYTNGSDLIQVFRVKQWLEHELKEIKADLEEASFERYFEFGEYIGEDCRKIIIVKSDTVMEILDKHIKENKE